MTHVEEMTHTQCEEFVANVLKIGGEMVRHGAEVRRAEDTMLRISQAYGFEVLSSYAVTAQVELTLKAPDGAYYSLSMRIDRTWNDLGCVEMLNAEARSICATRPAIEELPSRIEKAVHCRSQWLSDLAQFLGYVIAAAGFAVFFGGSWLDGLASGAVAIVIYLMDRYMGLRKVNYMIYTVFACFVAGSLAELCVRFGFGHSVDTIMIGDVMLFIPGMATVNGVKEMFYRDIMTGVLRIVEALLIAAAISVGYACAILLFARL